MILILLSITIFGIYKKYNNYSSKNINFITLKPLIEETYIIKNYQIEDNHVVIHLENDNGNTKLIRSYDIKNGKLHTEIKIK